MDSKSAKFLLDAYLEHEDPGPQTPTPKEPEAPAPQEESEELDWLKREKNKEEGLQFKRSLDEALFQGEELLKQDKPTEAEAILEGLLSQLKEPSNKPSFWFPYDDIAYQADTYYALGRCRQKQGDPQGAARYLFEALARSYLYSLEEQLSEVLRLCGKDEPEITRILNHAKAIHQEKFPPITFARAPEPYSFETDPLYARFFAKPRVEGMFSLVTTSEILEWSYGEVKDPALFDEETGFLARCGLLSQKIFGPIRDYTCECGKYNGLRSRGIVCEKCGVEVILSKVRGERRGHIQLACPVIHPWFYRGRSSWLAALLKCKEEEILSVLRGELFLVARDERYTRRGWRQGERLTQAQANAYAQEVGVEIQTGPEAIVEYLKQLDLYQLREELFSEGSPYSRAHLGGIDGDIELLSPKQEKIMRRLDIVQALCSSGKAESIALEVLPVPGPDYPLPPKKSGAMRDRELLQGCYVRILSANEALKFSYEESDAEKIVLFWRLELQRATDALFDFFSGLP